MFYSTYNEPYLLKDLINYNFVLNIISTFQDYDNIYTITTYYKGESLEYFQMNTLKEEQIKFISACVIQALVYLREKKIIHRDILMKNLIMDEEKYFNLIDFSYSIDYENKDNKKLYLNTYNKVSPPEMLNLSLYDYNSDYYRLGSIIFFLIFKTHPLIIKEEKHIKDITIDYHVVKNYSKNCIDFMNKLLISDYKKRIGYNDINELKNHSFFKGFDWINFEKKKIISPFNFVPNNKSKKCIKFKSIQGNLEELKKYSEKNKMIKSVIQNFDNFVQIMKN